MSEPIQKVFITNKGSHDYSDAARFGTLIYCTDGLVPKFNTNQMVREFEEVFANSDENDYILLTSLTTLCSMACSVFTAMHGRLNLLIFKNDRYIVRRVVFNSNK